MPVHPYLGNIKAAVGRAARERKREIKRESVSVPTVPNYKIIGIFKDYFGFNIV